jgi:hypothetical protein
MIDLNDYKAWQRKLDIYRKISYILSDKLTTPLLSKRISGGYFFIQKGGLS